MEFRKQVNWQTHTGGTGFYSAESRTVRITEVYLAYIDDDAVFGELRAKFNTRDWDIEQHGLIYTDSRWIEEFRALMKTLGFGPKAVEDITYSEQGMQGEDFVSMDVGSAFLAEVEPMYRFVINRGAINVT